MTTTKKTMSSTRVLIQPSAWAKRHQRRLGMRSTAGAVSPATRRTTPIVTKSQATVGCARHAAQAPAAAQARPTLTPKLRSVGRRWLISYAAAVTGAGEAGSSRNCHIVAASKKKPSSGNP